MSMEEVKQVLRELPDVRAPLPVAFGDPAFVKCLMEAADTPELVAQFNRLYGGTLGARAHPIEVMIDKATGKQDDDMRKFSEFVHDSIYLRLPNEAIHALRLGSSAIRSGTIRKE
jgi:hypothetical protein